ncbi:AAA family ATPase [Phormidesmis priestleyi]
MIPQQLTLKNFLSYRAATLDFRGLHTACVCGSNGAGKSSLLEAISWVIWGESRVAVEDDVIHIGTKEAQVDFIFSIHQQTYRVIRTRQRGQGVLLEFQIAQGEKKAESGQLRFRSLTEKGIRATQQLILEHLKLDYETFVNSAYLRQGRADEFMLRRPAERKQILADLLKLQRYDQLAEQAKDKSRQFKGQMELLERNLATNESQLQQRETIAQECTELELNLSYMQQQQIAKTTQLQTLKARQQQRQAWQQQLTWQQQQQRNLSQDCQRLQQEFSQADHQKKTLETLLRQQNQIVLGYQQWQTLQSQEEILSTRFQSHQVAQTKRQNYQQQQTEKLSGLHNRKQQIQAQEAALIQQTQEIQRTLSKAIDIEAGMGQLRQARLYLSQLDQLQMQAAPLIQRRQQVQSQVDRASTRLSARLDEVRSSAYQLQTQQQRQPKLQKAAVEIATRIEELQRIRIYQEQVREKGLERRSFMERLQAHQRDHEAQLAELDQKIRMLKQDVCGSESYELSILNLLEDQNSGLEKGSIKIQDRPKIQDSSYPPCPLCDRPLDEHHWNLVLEKHQQQQQEVLDQIWVIREQLAVSEREIQVLRGEYRELDEKLTQYGTVLERRGQLQEQLQVTADVQKSLEQLNAEATQLEAKLKSGDYATEFQEELQLLDRSLQQINYDEKDHALARGAIDRWRWAEIKQAEVKQAKRRQAQIEARQPELKSQLADIEQQIDRLDQETAAGLRESDRQIAAIDYRIEQHDALRQALRQAQPWQLRYQELCQAQQQFPQVDQRLHELDQTLQTRLSELQIVSQQMRELIHCLEQMPDSATQIQALEQHLLQQRQELDDQLSRLGRLQQQQQQQEQLSSQNLELKSQLRIARQQTRVYQELAQAFGKNGIQALMIENVLPQLEATTNQILSRLSANQLHVQFVTQRGRSSTTKSQTSKLAETLDILIADTRGTRAYETYSGGEAFRVNFAIRLALARLLSQRSGTALQMLIVDEGFGTQDQEGCDRLVAAINAIAPDFACILTVTHMPYFKEAFQARIEVTKTQEGSQIILCV